MCFTDVYPVSLERLFVTKQGLENQLHCKINTDFPLELQILT